MSMERILSASRDWPLHGIAASRQIEQHALAGTEPHALMRRAGAAVAALARALCPHMRSAWVACGPGNNGGDGLEAAMHLHASGVDVEVTLAADIARLPADARSALERAQAAGVPISPERTSSDVPDIAIDALLGLGSNRPPDAALAEWIRQLNALTCPVLAIDLPSGLNADTGQAHGEHCVVATHTLALLSIELDSASLTAKFSAAARRLATRQHAQHKGSFGDVAVVGGAPGMTGAALLAARAAHAAGAGRVYVNLLDGGALALEPQRPELMFRPSWWQEPAQTLRQATVVCGCGGGDAVRAALPKLLS
jgi:hydroxyethylthiazole kinase-like uncharacterized protein yjeF